MTRIVVSGCNGKMGHEIVSIISETPDCQVAAGIDIHITGNEGFPAFVNAEEFSGEADVLIDFFPSFCPFFPFGAWQKAALAFGTVHHRL